MPRGARPAIQPPIHLHTTIPQDLWTRMTLHLWSPAEKRVPKGAYQQFLVGLVRNYFANLESNDVRPEL